MSNAKLDALAKTGTAPTVISALQGLEANVQRIQGEGYRPDKEREHLGKVQKAAADQLQKYLQDDEHAADAERDKDLAALEAELIERSSIPRRQVGESDGEYNGRLSRRHLEETRRNSALLLAVADSQTIRDATDPAMIVDIVDELLSTRAPAEAVVRVGRTAEAKLQAMAAAETRDGAPPGPAFQAHMLTADKLRAWRAEHARESPEVKRDQILRRHTLRTMNTRNNVLAAAKLFNLEGLLTRAAAMAALQTKEG